MKVTQDSYEEGKLEHMCTIGECHVNMKSKKSGPCSYKLRKRKISSKPPAAKREHGTDSISQP